MTATGPQVSVVVPTRDRPERLSALLAALRQQTLARERFEVIVVDDGSESSTTQHVLAGEASGELSVVALRNDVALGQSSARNRGWRAARGELVAFTDDDCTPDPAWLSEALSVWAAAPCAFVQGRTEPDPVEAARVGAFSRTVVVDALGPQYQTCNIFYPRALLESLGGFDETFGQPVTGEDTDFAWRALEAGTQAVFAPDALVVHAVHQLGAVGMLREAARWRDVPRVFARHPGARVMLSRGVFWNGWHYCVIRSAVALTLPAPARRWLLMHHARQLVGRAHDSGSGAWAAPFLLAYDVVELAAIARGAIRYRTLVL